MRIATPRRGRREPGPPEPNGVARLDRRTKNLTKRLRPGDVAIIDHLDLDRVSAEALVGCGVAAVVNAAPSTSGRYPNLGPQIVVDAGITAARRRRVPEVMTAVAEGDVVRVEGDVLLRGDEAGGPGHGCRPGRASRRRWRRRGPGLSEQIEAFAGKHHGIPAPGAGPAAGRGRRARHLAPSSRAGTS